MKFTKKTVAIALLSVLALAIIFASQIKGDIYDMASDEVQLAIDTPDSESDGFTEVGRSIAVSEDSATEQVEMAAAEEFKEGNDASSESVVARQLRQTSEIVLEVSNLDQALEDARKIAESNNGFIANESTSFNNYDDSKVVVRVEASKFDAALAQIKELGSVRSISQTTEDVTLQVVDLETKVATTRASAERLQGLIAQANSLSEIVELEQELLRRETELASFDSQLKVLQNQVSYATISVTFAGGASLPNLSVTQTFYADHDAGQSCGSDKVSSLSEGDDATVCYEIVNNGATSLTDISVEDLAIDISSDDVIVVDGSLTETLAVGQAVVVAVEFDADRTLRTQTVVTAQPTDADGTEIGAPIERDSNLVIQVDQDYRIDGFTDGVEVGWNFVKVVASLLVLAAGLLLPLIILSPVVWFTHKLVRRHLRKKTTKLATD